MGSPCTKDCSGHQAGFNWSQRNGNSPAATPSPSFNNGAAINHAKATNTRKQGGGRIKGQLSPTQRAIQRRQQRAARSAVSPNSTTPVMPVTP
jgi:hypothetical protein